VRRIRPQPDVDADGRAERDRLVDEQQRAELDGDIEARPTP
jgi:hypothetical protein